MNILEKAKKILRVGYVCDHCLGRQFAQLLSGFGNKERGEKIRMIVAMDVDINQSFDGMYPSNFFNFNFRSEKLNKKRKRPDKCCVCKGLFETLDDIIKKVVKKIKKIEFNSFLVGTKLSEELLRKEEELWEEIGIEYCEPLKAELNREVGKRLEKVFGVKANLLNPDINVIINLSKSNVEIKINPLFVYGEYQKLIRGIPQTKWPSGKYKTSIEQIITKPLMKVTKGSGHKFHGLGREDIDARCLGWRPFVIEILEPKKRNINLIKIEKEINKGKKVKVRNLRFSSIKEVRKLKETKADKTYRICVLCESEITSEDLKKIRNLAGSIISQRTPLRVVHRRADKVRKRKLIDIKVRKISKRKLILTLTTESGFYVKEFITGDKGRTNPSISSVLGCKCEPKDLDVIKIYYKNRKK